MPTNYDIHDYDVLVIGAGGAGMRAAIEAAEAGLRTGLVCKSLLGKAHTVMAEGGMAAALGNVEKNDNWKVHFVDTMFGGKFLNNWRMAQLHAQESPDRARELESWGAVFDRTEDGQILQRNFGGHAYPRLAHVGDRTGLELIRTLQERVVASGRHPHRAEQEIKVHMECTIFRLLKTDGRVTGAMGYWRESGKPIVFRAKAVVLATGGLGKCYRVTSNSWEGTGDGHALAYLAGAELLDMEFIQFHPTGMVWPPSVRGILVTEGVRGEGGVLKNNKGERFMFGYIPDLYKKQTADTPEEGEKYIKKVKGARRPPELLTRDVVARAIVREVKEGRGSPHGGAYLDIATRLPAEDIKKKLPSMYHQFMALGNLDITKEPMEVGPTCHYAMGGVRVNPETQESTVPGLFAAGEVAGGLHGSNRLGGNSLSDLIVFGRRAGLHASEFAKQHPELAPVDPADLDALVAEMYQPFERAAGENAFQITSNLQDTMEANVGIARVEGELQQALSDIQGLKQRAATVGVTGDKQFNPGWHQAISLEFLLVCSEAIAKSALERRESRGGHMRVDHLDTLDEYGTFNHVVWRGEDGTMKLRREPIPAMPDDLAALIEEKKKNG
ncbi:MAG: fumarate reductase/succinate dehydrogenase flavoprotein subunit [Candidatus Sericytochromatia bacterium]|nr:fumarate reductase/succinate dehydrogenase flavoprotein subunit [Candidatus Sericytochromatia bacterium]